jgi:uncharacterized protein (DUF3820 family)
VTIEDNVKEGKLAGEAATLVVDFARELGVDQLSFYLKVLAWLQMHKKLPLEEEKKDDIKKMNDVQVARFENQLMPYGEFAGKSVKNVPLDRLQWYADQKFTDQLRLYLKSSKIKREVALHEQDNSSSQS